MKEKIIIAIFTLAFLSNFGLTLSNKPLEEYYKGRDFAYAKIRSCSGWRLNSLPEMRKFVMEEIRDWEDITVEFTGGDPTLHLFNNQNQIIASKVLGNINRINLYELLNQIGIFKKTNSESSGIKITVTNVPKDNQNVQTPIGEDGVANGDL